MSLTVTDEPDAERFSVHDGEELRGFIGYDRSGAVLQLIHVEVPPFLRNKGVGGEVMQAVVDFLRAENSERVQPRCPFAVMWMRRHPEYADLMTR